MLGPKLNDSASFPVACTIAGFTQKLKDQLVSATGLELDFAEIGSID